MELEGKVVQKKFAQGSKSESDAFFLETEKGIFKLAKVGENPFENKGLKKWLGKRVRVEGSMKEYLFLAKTIQAL